jgi:hypothetical protein
VIVRRLTIIRRLVVLAALACGLVPASAIRASAQAPDDPHEQMIGEGPELLVKLFGSVDWGASQLPAMPNSFELGQFAVFVTSSLSDHISVLAEIVMEAGGTNTRVVTDLERLQVTFRLNDKLSLSAGRYHTDIGYYNAAFHHASYFETTIGRPRVYAFEDEGGVLPVHEVGLTMHGIVPKTGNMLHYVAEVGNGRSWTTPADGAEGRDSNSGKSTNVGLSLQPRQWRGVNIGTSYYRDEILHPTLGTVDHRITTAYGVYRTPSTEVIAEWLRLTYLTSDGRQSDSLSGYAQASHAFGKLRPYYRYDRLGIDPAAPFIGAFEPYKAHIAGIRIDPAEWIGLKAQYERLDQGVYHGINAVRTQLVFVF